MYFLLTTYFTAAALGLFARGCWRVVVGMCDRGSQRAVYRESWQDHTPTHGPALIEQLDLSTGLHWWVSSHTSAMHGRAGEGRDKVKKQNK